MLREVRQSYIFYHQKKTPNPQALMPLSWRVNFPEPMSSQTAAALPLGLRTPSLFLVPHKWEAVIKLLIFPLLLYLNYKTKVSL